MISYTKKGFTPSPNEAGISKVKHEVPQVVPHEKRYSHNFFRREKSIVPRLVRGFTLIELLVVIAIIAILAVAVILTLNPAELLRQSRDSTRVSDLNTLKSALALYITDQSSAAGYALGTSRTCYQSLSPASTSCTVFGTQNAILGSASRLVDGTGWLPVKFNLVTSGAPIGNLPSDPTNNLGFFYAYVSSSTSNTFKLAALLESVKYSSSGVSDLSSTDGGTSVNWYETGTNLAL